MIAFVDIVIRNVEAISHCLLRLRLKISLSEILGVISQYGAFVDIVTLKKYELSPIVLHL